MAVSLNLGLGMTSAFGQSIEAPDRRVGDSCTVVRTVQGRALQPMQQVVTEILSDGYRAENRNPAGFVIENWEFSAEGNPKSRRSTAGVINWSPHQPFFRWPMKPGDEWKEGYRYSISNGSGKVQIHARVLEWEVMSVPVGTVRALKISLAGRYEEETSSGSGSGKRDILLWFDPLSGCIIKSVLRATRWDGSAAPEELTELTAFARAQR